MTSKGIIIVIVLAVYLASNLVIGLVVSKRQAKRDAEKGFVNNYFIGGRSMGGLVLAMTLIATFTSASSFIGGPGIAASKGLVWVYLSMIQVPTAFIILGILGKKFAVISRKINAVTVTDYLRARYKSPAVVIISSICLVLFFVAQMVSQFMGGAILFQEITGMPYIWGLLIFSVIVIIYTTVGGFSAVVITDTVQGLIMILGGIILLATVVGVAGGFGPLSAKLAVAAPYYADITSGGTTAMPYVLSFWVLVGIGVLGLPQTAVRGMGFKNTKSLHSAIIYGTIVVGFLMLIMHVSGVFAPAIIDISKLPSTDYVVPAIVLKYMNPVVAGIFIAAPLAAIMSTVSSLLILASAAIVKDLYMNYMVKDEEKASPEFIKSIPKKSMAATLVLGFVVIILAILKPDLIVWVNLFAMGGLECAFFCPILFGLYWKKANATGAIVSSICSVASFGFITIYNSLINPLHPFSIGGTTAIIPCIVIAIVTFVVFSLIGKKPDHETLELFYAEK
jgi:sodium/pantothenate symporter